MASFREKFGLDYLKGSLPTSGVSPDMEEAIIAYSRPLLDALYSSPEKTSQLFDLAKKLRLRLDEFIPVVKYLISKQYITVVKPDELGNDTVCLTAVGQKLLTSER